MGKRELLLILAFLALGTVVYQVTAPEPPPDQRGSGWSRFWRDVRGELAGRHTRVEVTRTAGQPLAAGVDHLQVADFRGEVIVVGEDRETVEAELTADVYGVDGEEARAEAAAVRLGLRAEGPALAVETEGLSEGRRPRARLHVRVPRRVAVRVQAIGRVEVSQVASVELDTRGGAVTVRDVAGPVRGEHRDGDLLVSASGPLALDARRGHVRIEDLRGSVSGAYVDGRLTLRAVAGAVDVETRRVDVELDGPAAQVAVTATDGSVSVRHPQGAFRFEGRRSRLTMVADRATGVEVTASDAPVDLTMAGSMGVSLDLAAEDGRLDLPPDLGVEAARSGRRLEARAAVSGGGPVWKVRTTRADIVVRRPDGPRGAL